MTAVYSTLVLIMVGLLGVTWSCDLQTNVDCSSVHYQYATCPVVGTGSYTSIWVIKKYSKSSCKKGDSYGFLGNYIWVNKGCRAKFGVCSCNKHKLVDCSSHNYKYATCHVSGVSELTYIDLASKKSKSACVKNHSYGITGTNVWVDKGCRARFNVCYH